MRMTASVATLTCLIFLCVSGVGGDRFVKKLPLPSGQTAVVAEGDFEPRSIGSYSLRVYRGADPRFPTDDFVTGVVRPRDGTVEKVVLEDLDDDGGVEIIVIVRCAGTGSYLSADALRLAKGELILVASVEGLAAGADPVVALKAAAAKGR